MQDHATNLEPADLCACGHAREEHNAKGCVLCKPGLCTLTYQPVENVNGFLSGKAGYPWPGALVIQIEGGPRERWILRRAGLPDVGLGDSFKHARMALYAMIKTTPKPGPR